MRGSLFCSVPPVVLVVGGFFWSSVSATFSQSTDTGTEASWHQFRDQQGHEVEARVLSLSSDLRQVKIERRDGQVFDLVITRLSLDDQQFLRDWLLQPRQLDPESTRIELAASRQEVTGERTRLKNQVDEIQWESREFGYEISVNNQNRFPLAGLRLEYCLLSENFVEVMASDPSTEPTADPEEITRLFRAPSRGSIEYHFASIELPPLLFNREQAVQTVSLPLDSVSTRGDTREQFDDRGIGILLRLVAADGTILAEKTDLIREHSTLDWAAFSHRRDPREEAGAGMLTEVIVSNAN